MFALNGYGDNYEEACQMQTILREKKDLAYHHISVREEHEHYMQKRIATGKNSFFRSIKQKRYNFLHKYNMHNKEKFLTKIRKQRQQSLESCKRDSLCLSRKYLYDTSRFVGTEFRYDHYPDIILLRDRIAAMRSYPFEDTEFMGFADSHYFLNYCYGDYMTLPPPEKRFTHNPYYLNLNLPCKEWAKQNCITSYKLPKELAIKFTGTPDKIVYVIKRDSK
ncbi:LicD family protein [Helicobacter aurati]|uniref:hypothetical protein n=1 Tax=Helicobacter aurati TaxID=137778 RepID=UPI001F331E3F|nr:hypothetical protein [Helicobacter aurati]